MFNIPNRLTVKSIRVTPPKIYITPDAYVTISELVKQCDYEISWFSRIEEINKNAFVIEDAMLLSQEVTASSAEFSEKELSAFMNDILKNHGIDFYNKIRCWGHSHVNFAASPSGQDLKQIMQFNEQDYYIMLIVNKKGDAHVAFYDFKNNTIFENVPIQLYLPNSGDISKQVKQSIGEKVKLLSIKNKIQPGAKQISMNLTQDDRILNQFHSAFRMLYKFFKAENRDGDPYISTMELVNSTMDDKTCSGIMQRANSLRTTGLIFNPETVSHALKVVRTTKYMLKIDSVDDYEEWQNMCSEILLDTINDSHIESVDALIYALTQKGEIEDVLDTEIAVDEYIALRDIEEWCLNNGMDAELCSYVTNTLEELQEECFCDYREIILTLYNEMEYYEDEEVEE